MLIGHNIGSLGNNKVSHGMTRSFKARSSRRSLLFMLNEQLLVCLVRALRQSIKLGDAVFCSIRNFYCALYTFMESSSSSMDSPIRVVVTAGP